MSCWVFLDFKSLHEGTGCVTFRPALASVVSVACVKRGRHHRSFRYCYCTEEVIDSLLTYTHTFIHYMIYIVSFIRTSVKGSIFGMNLHCCNCCCKDTWFCLSSVRAVVGFCYLANIQSSVKKKLTWTDKQKY